MPYPIQLGDIAVLNMAQEVQGSSETQHQQDSTNQEGLSDQYDMHHGKWWNLQLTPSNHWVHM